MPPGLRKPAVIAVLLLASAPVADCRWDRPIETVFAEHEHIGIGIITAGSVEGVKDLILRRAFELNADRSRSASNAETWPRPP